MPEPFFIVGPTAVGKTELAVEAAERCGAEIISADAFQVYEGLATLTAKPSRDELGRVRHHLIGHVPRSETYNVARYHSDASECLRDAAARGRPVIVVGGSGLYVKALTHGLSPLPPAQPGLRLQLEQTDLPDLLAELSVLDPPAAAAIDPRNKRRVVRALEVCLATGARFSDQQSAWHTPRPPVRGAFIVREKAELAARIERRSRALLRSETLDEVRQALESPLSETADKIIGLAEIRAYMAGEMTGADCVEKMRTATRRYAKRQMTWFRGESFAERIDLSDGTDLLVHAKLIAEKISAAAQT